MDIQIAFVLLIILILICMGFILPKSKLLFFLQAVVMWIMMSFNNGGGDYQGNEEIFQVANIGSIKNFFLDSGLYQAICIFFRTLGLNFFQMYFVVSTIAFFCVLLIIKKNTCKRSLVLSLCMLYPFTDYIIQKRNFLIVPILLYCIPYLFKNTKKGNIIYCVGCGISGLIHVTGYVYLIYFFIYKILSIKKIKFFFLENIYFLLILELIALPFIPKIAELVFPKWKVDAYFYQLLTSKMGMLYTIFIHILFFLIVEYINRKCKKYNTNPELLKNIKTFNRISLLFIPLYFYGAVFARIYVYMLPYTYLVLSNVKIQIKRPLKNALVIYVFAFVYILAVAFINYGIYNSGFSNLVVPLFRENVLIRLFY